MPRMGKACLLAMIAVAAMAQEPDDADFVPDPSGSIACQLEQNPTPNTEPLEW